MKRNVVSALKGGISQNSISRRLGIPGTTIIQWKRNPKYADVPPAGEGLLNALPPDPSKYAATYRGKEEGGHLVQIPFSVRNPPAEPQSAGRPMKITFGKLTFESDSFSSDAIAMIVRALGDADVL